MAVLDNNGLSHLWDKIKLGFGHSLAAAPYPQQPTNSSYILLNDGAGNQLSAITLQGVGGTKAQSTGSGNITIGAFQAVPEAGDNIEVSGPVYEGWDKKYTISAKDTTYTAGANVTIDDDNVISASDTQYGLFTTTKAGLVPATGEVTDYADAAFMFPSCGIQSGGVTPSWHGIQAGTGLEFSNTTSKVIGISGTLATQSATGMMSAADKTKLDGIANGATKVIVDSALSSTSANPVQNKAVNTALAGKVNGSGSIGSATRPIYVNNGTATMSSASVGADDQLVYMSGGVITASDKTVGSASKPIFMSDGHLVPCTASVGDADTPAYMNAGVMTACTGVASKSYVDAQVAGAATFQGLVDNDTSIKNSSYKAGWYWVVRTAGTFCGQACEVGDTIFAQKTKGTAYADSDFNVLQVNLEAMTDAEIDAICTF